MSHSIELVRPVSLETTTTEIIQDEVENFLPKRRQIFIIATISSVGFLSSLSTGLLTVGLPHIAIDINLPEYLLLWPASVYNLTTGSVLLIAGSIADVLGNRLINLVGCFFVGCFMIAFGVARTGIELILFRAFQGIALSLCLPTSVAIVANSIPLGRRRNIGFACLGLVQNLGFSTGMIIEGLIQDTLGWRVGFYLCGALTLISFLATMFIIPNDNKQGSKWKKLRLEIDWLGAVIACSFLSLFSYCLAILSNNVSNIQQPNAIATLSISLTLIVVFIFWEHRQEKSQKPALIPNSLWRNSTFSSVCLMLIFSYAVVNAMEVFCSLFFQNVQNLSALDTSLRILPSLIVGAIAQIFMGLLIHKLSAFYVVVTSLILSSGAPLLMALIHIDWPYWYNAFFAQILSPLSADTLFTVGLLVVSDVFPTRTQALAGAVFNTVAQFGTSIGLTVMAVISSSSTMHSGKPISSSDGLMIGYRASFWAAFAWMALACLIGAFGLRGMGRVGLKRE